MVAVNATIFSELLNARSLTQGQIHDVTLRPMCARMLKIFSLPTTTNFLFMKFYLTKYFQLKYFPIYGSYQRQHWLLLVVIFLLKQMDTTEGEQQESV